MPKTQLVKKRGLESTGLSRLETRHHGGLSCRVHAQLKSSGIGVPQCSSVRVKQTAPVGTKADGEIEGIRIHR